MRRASKTDANQAEIVGALRAIGATVQPLHAVGQGCPDLLVGYRGVNYCLEVKDHAAAKSDRQLNPRQVEWHAAWRGHVAKVETVEDAFQAIGLK